MNKAIESITILYIEDAVGYIYGVKSFLSPYPEYKVISAETLEDGQQIIENNQIDVLLLDLRVGPNQDPNESIDLITYINDNKPGVPIILYSTIGYLRSNIVRAVLRAGASYIIKEDFSGEMLDRVIHISLSVGIVYSEAVVRYFENILLDEEKSPLTKSELEIAALIAKEMPNKQIAYKLDKSEPRVREQVSKIIRKLGVRTRSGIAMWFNETYPNGTVN